MEKYKVFYSWQSDLPNSTNRGFIEKALEGAAKAIRSDESIEIEPVIDRDTAGIPGAPDIASTIFAKIDQSQVFACDVSIINQDEKSRPTANPNVLIELGYALNALGWERILMIMNTAFGPPEILPFDLSKKRVVTYDMPEGCQNRSQERKQLENKLNTALRTIFTEIEKNPSKEDTQKSLHEKCIEMIDQDKIVLWRQFIEKTTEEIIKKLLAWKQTGEAAISEVQRQTPTNWEPWKIAVLEAVKMSIPGFIPILTSMHISKEKYWQESTSFLRRLILLRKDMGGGTTLVLEIGDSILYVMGAIGMALAVCTKQINFVQLWAELVLPNAEGTGQSKWYQKLEINYWQTGVTGHNNDPYGFIIKSLEASCIKPFFESAERFKQSLFIGNLLHSLIEFKYEASNKEYENNIMSTSWQPSVMPVWCLMKPDDFRKEAWRIFSSSGEVIKFAYPGIMPDVQKFWPLWQAWKQKCVQFMSDGGKYHRHLHNVSWLNLPGEPPIRP